MQFELLNILSGTLPALTRKTASSINRHLLLLTETRSCNTLGKQLKARKERKVLLLSEPRFEKKSLNPNLEQRNSLL